MSLAYRTLTGGDITPHIDTLAQLRITVFRDFPYLYDGDMGYERDYLRTYVESPGAVIVGAFDQDRMVGAATGTPMEDHADDFGAAFEGRGVPLEAVFYCAESVLLPGYRGRGAGHAFFDGREDHARTLGRTTSAFCSVIRPPDHPARPPGYRPLDGFWRKRGYVPLDGVTATFRWRDLGQADQSAKTLQFWIRDL